MTSAPPTQNVGLVSNVQNFVSENKKLVIGVLAAAVAVTVVAVVFTSSSSSSQSTDLERGDEKKSSKKKKSKSSKPKKGVADPSGPVLEEVQPEDSLACS